jgi:hypothetical protein
VKENYVYFRPHFEIIANVDFSDGLIFNSKEVLVVVEEVNSLFNLKVSKIFIKNLNEKQRGILMYIYLIVLFSEASVKNYEMRLSYYLLPENLLKLLLSSFGEKVLAE